jgi:hypothetical protein
MTPAQREAVKELLLELLAAPAERQPVILNAINDELVRAEVERLLSLRSEAGAFLQGPAVNLTSQATPAERLGSVIGGRYRLDARIGSGGFGDVFKAEDTLLGRPVAVKLLHQGVLSETTLRHELHALAALDHPGVVGVLDAGCSEDRRHFLVLRYVDGPSLRQVLSEGKPLSSSFAKRTAIQLAEALGVAHRLGVLHLDLKPENIMIKEYTSLDAQAVIVDFGVGALLEGSSVTSIPSSAAAYQAPELAHGEQLPQSDLYSLGAVLFEMVSGRRFARKPSFSQIPGPWRSVVSRLLESDPAKRFSSAYELRIAIERIDSVRWKTSATIIAASTILAAAILQWSRTGGEPKFSDPIPFTALPGEESYPRFSADGRRVYFAWARDLGNSDIYVKALAGGDPVQLTSHPARDYGTAASPDGRFIAFQRDRGAGRSALIVMPSSGGTELEIAEDDFDGITWTPLQNTLLAATAADAKAQSHELRLLNLQTHE